MSQFADLTVSWRAFHTIRKNVSSRKKNSMRTAWLVVPITCLPFTLGAISEASFNQIYESSVRPYVQENGVEGETRMPDGALLRYLTIRNPDERLILVVLGGHAESYVKYAELFYNLRDLGVSIHALDQRGEGFSSRMLADREKDYIGDSTTYVADLEQFMRAVVRPGPNERVLILGHSLGGAVAAAYAERHPSEVSGLILSSPYLGSKAGPVAMFEVRLLDLFGAGKEYMPGGGPFTFVPFEKNKETSSRVRHERKFQDYADSPEIRLGYPTNHWMVEMDRLGRRIRRDAGKIACPTLVLQAANDEYASRAVQDAFCAHVAKCQNVVLQGALHEVLIERDEIREVALAKVRAFIQDQSQ